MEDITFLRLEINLWPFLALAAIAIMWRTAPPWGDPFYTKCRNKFADCTNSPFTYVGVTAWVAGLSILESRVRDACRVSLCVYVPLAAYMLWRIDQRHRPVV